MKRVGLECRQAKRDLLRRGEIDAVARSRMELHLRRCESCRQVADDLAAIEAARPRIEEITILLGQVV